MTTLAGLFTIRGSDDANGIAPIFNKSIGLSGDGTSLYIADFKNNAIRKLTPP